MSVFSFEQEQQFFHEIKQMLDQQTFERLILSQYKGELTQLEKITFRVVELHGKKQLSALYHHTTQDVTKNYSFEDGLEQIAALITQCKQANLFSTHQEIQLKKNKKKAMLNMGKKHSVTTVPTVQAHDREKQRYVQQGSAFLKELGITDEKAQIIPSMARKWKQINKFIQNTRQFLQNLPANDVLLTGSRGTGKSSIVRALLTEYKDQGLRLIEIERDDLSDLPEIQKLIQKRPEKFIVYCDDLAFNAEDENYRSLKSVLDGSLQSGSSNFIIYATSNRRHLLPEFMHENTPVTRVDVPQYTELHPQEAIEEKISLSDRFGMWLSFYPMDQNLYLTIVEHYLAKTDMPMNDEAHAEALRWCQARGQRSGRAAYQFSKHWIGSQQLKAL
ncbi:ATP-binding protein [Acinetobacter baumannii]|uniref:ATP-binding protein n=1 Tax=Acinetobacter baumannii TaxID=470 RepID=UPI0038CDBB03